MDVFILYRKELANLHIVDYITPVLQVGGGLVNELLAIGFVGSLVRVEADQLSIAIERKLETVQGQYMI